MTSGDFKEFLSTAQTHFPGLAGWLETLAERTDDVMQTWFESMASVALGDAVVALKRIHRGEVKVKGEVYRPWWPDFPPVLCDEAKRVQAVRTSAARSERENAERRNAPRNVIPDGSRWAMVPTYISERIDAEHRAWYDAPERTRRERSDLIRELRREVWPDDQAEPVFPEGWRAQPRPLLKTVSEATQP